MSTDGSPRNRAIALFVVLAFALSWAVFVPLALAEHSVIAPLPPWLHLIGAYGPAVAALIVTALTSGRAALVELGRRLTRRPARPALWLLALSPLFFYVVALVPARLLSGAWPLGGFGVVSEVGARGAAGWPVWALVILTAIVLGRRYGPDSFAPEPRQTL